MKMYNYLLTASFICFSYFSLAQDKNKSVKHFSGTASVTNNGIALVPNFSLEKPATLFLSSIGGERFSVDTDIRFGLDGKPWTMLFWGRYKIATKTKFKLHTGANIGLNYRNTNIIINTTPSENIIARRYIGAELSPSFQFTKKISVGMYYFYSRGLDPGTSTNNHFVTLNANVSNIALTKQFFLRITPQVFYLYQDGRQGNFATGIITLSKNKFPLSLSYLANKRISGNIQSKDFINSFSILYTFNKKYISQ